MHSGEDIEGKGLFPQEGEETLLRRLETCLPAQKFIDLLPQGETGGLGV